MDKRTMDIIEHNLKGSFSGEHTFPEVVKNLIAAGVERYYTDLVALKTTYYAMDGTHCTIQLPYQNDLKTGESFSEKEVIDALRIIQRGDIIYSEFLNRIIKAGTVNYTAFLLGKQVHYVSAKGEIYIEYFPENTSL